MGIVTVGVLLRTSFGRGAVPENDENAAVGLALTTASAALYSLLGVTYEVWKTAYRLMIARGLLASVFAVLLRPCHEGFPRCLFTCSCWPQWRDSPCHTYR